MGYTPAEQVTSLGLHLMSDEFRARLAALPDAPPRYAQSAARVRVRETFDAITDAKARGITWRSIAELMAADGLKALDGGELTASHVAALYASEKKARGIRPKRRAKKAKQPPILPVALTGTAPAPSQPEPQMHTVTAPAFDADEDNNDSHQRGKFRVVPARPRGTLPKQ